MIIIVLTISTCGSKQFICSISCDLHNWVMLVIVSSPFYRWEK